MRNDVNHTARARDRRPGEAMRRIAAGTVLAVSTGAAAMSCGAEAGNEESGELIQAASTPSRSLSRMASRRVRAMPERRTPA